MSGIKKRKYGLAGILLNAQDRNVALAGTQVVGISLSATSYMISTNVYRRTIAQLFRSRKLRETKASATQ